MSKLRPSVCIDAVLGDLETAAAVQLVKDAGSDAFEFWCWWEKDFDAIIAISVALMWPCCGVCEGQACSSMPLQYLPPIQQDPDAFAANLKQEKGIDCTVMQVGDTLEC